MISSQNLTSQRKSQNNITEKIKARITSQEYHHKENIIASYLEMFGGGVCNGNNYCKHCKNLI